MSAEIYKLGNGRFIVAQWLERSACYVASLSRESKRLTGCSQASAPTLESLAKQSGVPTYATSSAARRALDRAMGYE